jgi:cobalt-zinc-cadmium efflux system outer membrane protein
MRFKSLALASVLAAWPWLIHAQPVVPPTDLPAAPVQPSSAAPLTLAEAWRLAEQTHPLLRSRQAQLEGVQGLRDEASTWLNSNPQLALENTRRQLPQSGLPTERRSEWNIGLSQTFEIAGQRRHRLAASEAALAALQAEIEDTRRQVHAQVAQAFLHVLALQQRAEVDDDALKLFDDTAQGVHKRRQAGEDTKLDANVAKVEAERARNQLAQTREQLIDARAELATRLQLAPGVAPLVVGDLAERADARYSVEALLAAVDAQPRLQAITARQDGAQARLDLERAGRYPDVTVGLALGREGPGDARERLTTLSVSVPLPLFKRNTGGMAQASSELNQARIEREAALRDQRAQVYTLWTKLQSLQERVQRLQGTVLPTLADNQQLSLKSQRAGQISVLELIVVNRQALDARRELIDALGDLQAVRLALEAAAGWAQPGTQP